jgi:hypothetical protein
MKFNYLLILLLFFIMIGCSENSSSEYSSKISEAKEAYEKKDLNTTISIINNLQKTTDLKEEDILFYYDVLTERLNEYKAIKKELKYINTTAKVEGDYIYVTGAIKNNSDKTITFLKINFNQLGVSNEVIDSEQAFVVGLEGIKPNEQKYFDMMIKLRKGYNLPKLEIVDFQF